MLRSVSERVFIQIITPYRDDDPVPLQDGAVYTMCSVVLIPARAEGYRPHSHYRRLYQPPLNWAPWAQKRQSVQRRTAALLRPQLCSASTSAEPLCRPNLILPTAGPLRPRDFRCVASAHLWKPGVAPLTLPGDHSRPAPGWVVRLQWGLAQQILAGR